jgi:hypothetical protein
VFLVKVPWPVRLEVPIADQGSEFEDRFGPGQAPTGTCDIKTISHNRASVRDIASRLDRLGFTTSISRTEGGRVPWIRGVLG